MRIQLGGFFLSGIFSGVLLLTGCQNTVNRVENADRSMAPAVIRDRRFVTDGFLRDRLQLTHLVENTLPDGLKQVQLTAVNVRTGALAQTWSGLTGSNPYQVKYKFTWFDQNGMERPSELSTWRMIVVKPGEEVHLQAVAPDRDCKDFSINLQEAN